MRVGHEYIAGFIAYRGLGFQRSTEDSLGLGKPASLGALSGVHYAEWLYDRGTERRLPVCVYL